MNVEFQRIARREKKAFLSDQCKEIEGKNRMGNIGELFKKIRDTKRTFHAKMGLINDRNGPSYGPKWFCYGPKQKQKILRSGKNTHKNCTKKSFTTQIVTMV